MYWLRTEHACNRAIFGSSPICSQCLSARDVSQACSPGKRLIYSNRLLRNSIAVKFQVELAFRPASRPFISCSVKFQVEPPFRPASKLFISCSVKFQVEPAFRPASRLFISCSESASADGTGDAERIFQQPAKPLHSAAPYRKVLVGPRGDV